MVAAASFFFFLVATLKQKWEKPLTDLAGRTVELGN